MRFNQVMLVAIGGIIRGAIAFGLSLQIDSPNSHVLKTTTQVIVLGTTIVLGCLISVLAKCLKIKTDEEELKASIKKVAIHDNLQIPSQVQSH